MFVNKALLERGHAHHGHRAPWLCWGGRSQGPRPRAGCGVTAPPTKSRPSQKLPAHLQISDLPNLLCWRPQPLPLPTTAPAPMKIPVGGRECLPSGGLAAERLDAPFPPSSVSLRPVLQLGWGQLYSANGWPHRLASPPILLAPARAGSGGGWRSGG